MPVPHDIPAETELWDTYAASVFDATAEPSFSWTQYTGHGPGPELLGAPGPVLEIGCGTGRALAHLAQQGVKATPTATAANPLYGSGTCSAPGSPWPQP